jgi:DNA-binding LacI/PurR family transcriptional regulator
MKRQQRVTLKTLAEKMGMTPAAISKALVDKEDISIETRRRVKALAAKLGYRPNIIAKSLVQRRTFMLGVVVPDLRISFYSQVARGIYEKAFQIGYRPILMVNDDNIEIEKRNLEFFAALPVDGVLLNAAPGTTNTPLLRRMNAEGIHVVCYDRRLDELDFHSVTIDDEGTAVKVVDYLVEHGRKDILFLGPTATPSVGRDRYRGYCKGLQKHRIPYRREYVIDCRLDDNDARVALEKALQEGVAPDAVMTTGGLVAYGAGRALLNTGHAIPDDVFLVEFGDNDVISRLGVPFLTIDQSPYEMGKKAVEIIAALIAGDTVQPDKSTFVEARLLMRTVG